MLVLFYRIYSIFSILLTTDYWKIQRIWKICFTPTVAAIDSLGWISIRYCHNLDTQCCPLSSRLCLFSCESGCLALFTIHVVARSIACKPSALSIGMFIAAAMVTALLPDNCTCSIPQSIVAVAFGLWGLGSLCLHLTGKATNTTKTWG